MYKVQTLNKIDSIGLSQLPSQLYEIADHFPNPDAILLRSFSLHNQSVPDSVKVVARAGAGVNNIPVAKLTGLGIPVLNTPGANANAVKELVIAGMLLACRNLCAAWSYTKTLQGTNEALNLQMENDKKQFAGFELPGKTLGIIGLGYVGVLVANAAIALGMRVIGYDPSITIQHAWNLSSDVEAMPSLEALLAQADFISLHVPLIPATTNLLNADRLRLIKQNAILLNFARDGIVEKTALKEALDQNRLAYYVSDFPCVEFQDCPNVISLPHLGASTVEAEQNCAQMAVKQIKNYLENGIIENSINFPTVQTGANKGVRLTIVNVNVPSMVAQISTQLANAGINIIDLINKSRDDIAYTLIDIETLPDQALLEAISSIEGVLQVRCLQNTNS